MSTTAAIAPPFSHARTRRWLAAAFIAGQAFLFASIRPESRTVCVATLVIVGASFGLRSGWRPRGVWHAAGLILAGLGFALLHVRAAWQAGLLMQLHFTFANFLLIVQAFELLRPLRSPTANYLPGLGCLALTSMILSFDGGLPEAQLQWIYFGFVVALAWLLRPDLHQLLRQRDQSRKTITVLATLGLALSCGILFRQELRQDLPVLQRNLTGWQVSAARSEFAQTKSRFVETVTLESISAAQRNHPETPVFTVRSESPPGYMKTMSLTRFDGWAWRDRPPSRSASGEVRYPFRGIPAWLDTRDRKRAARELFALHASAVGPFHRFEITIPPGRGDFVPLPVRTSHILLNRRRIALDIHGSIVPGAQPPGNYVAYIARKLNTPSSAAYLTQLLDVPGSDSFIIRPLAQHLCRDAQTTREAARAIEQHFRSQHTYSLEPTVGRNLDGRSPLEAFIEERRAAHCEYFATATVLMLRAQEIPARLCVGYLVYEMNDGQDYFVALNRNAHAWAEAYDEASGQWFTVESTPGTAEYIEEYRNARVGEEDAVDAEQRDLADTTFIARLANMLEQSLTWLTTWRFAWLLPVAAIVSAIAMRRVRRSHHRRRQQPRWSKQLRRADRMAARLGVQRGPSETCHQFARRLQTIGRAEALADWYRQYARLRYTSQAAETLAAPPEVVPSR